jgi:hypothetical protein
MRLKRLERLIGRILSGKLLEQRGTEVAQKLLKYVEALPGALAGPHLRPS